MNNVYSAPSLQMHVFEEESNTTTNIPIYNPIPVFESSPARKHNLQTHVFERAPSVRTAKTSSSDGTSTIKDQKPILSYQKAEFYASTGYRQDELNWSIAAISGTPNIISELEWQDIEIAIVNIGTTLYLEPNWLLNVDLSYGHIFDGANQDSDYFGNNRTFEFSRSNNSADEGSVIDASIHAGYKWLALNNEQATLYLIPKIGFSYHAQFLTMTDAKQTVATTGITPPIGSFSGLHTTYDATWYGPWIGMDSELTIGKKLTLGLNFEYHYAFYDATANWNLRSDFAHPESFTQEAEGYGLVGSVDAKYRLDNKVSLTLSVNYQDWQADRNGINEFFFSDGTSPTSAYNGVNWKSFGANLGLAYQF
ncbi:MAG: hypothetical protein COA95_11400 [Methylophaga sp.]|nr:MAG: hypothetical protein COA95_11400 [Methylophaga sp.]